MTWDKTLRQLKSWMGDQDNLADEDLVPPSDETIEQATKLVKRLRDSSFVSPMAVVPDGEGGIMFEWRILNVFKSLEVSADGTVELLTFVDCNLVRTVKVTEVTVATALCAGI